MYDSLKFKHLRNKLYNLY